MKSEEIIKILEEKYPPSCAEEWDNPGLLLGRRDREVQKILVSLDVTDQAAERAISWGADMIVSHHPLIFRGIKKISDETFEFLMYYLAEYRELLQHQRFLFINIAGKTAGQPLKIDSVYDMLNRMEKKTGIDLTPHMLRRYFANMRRKAGWRLELIQQALGHKHIETTIKYLNIVDDELLEASEEFYAKHSALYGVKNLL